MLIDLLSRRLRERDAQGLARRRRTVGTACAPETFVDGRPMLAFCSNDYLGLANHPRVTEMLCEGARLHGAGSGASHLVSGHGVAHEALESLLADWYAPHIPGARALTFCTGYLANLALLTALGAEQATVLCDKLNHASLVDGALLSRALFKRYPHGDLARLEALLAEATTPIRLVVTDAVFSMDGDLADLPALLALCERHDAWLLVDDAHGFGVLGARGRGSLEHFALNSERLVLMGTLGKAAGVGGAFVAAHPVIVDWLLQTARPYIYTTAAPPAVAHAAMAAMSVIASAEGQQRRARLQSHVQRLRAGLAAMVAARGWQLADSATAIQPLIVGDNVSALNLSTRLEQQGLWVPAIRPPTVPIGSARLRISLSAAHTEDHVDRLLAALAAC